MIESYIRGGEFCKTWILNNTYTAWYTADRHSSSIQSGVPSFDTFKSNADQYIIGYHVFYGQQLMFFTNDGESYECLAKEDEF